VQVRARILATAERLSTCMAQPIRRTKSRSRAKLFPPREAPPISMLSHDIPIRPAPRSVQSPIETLSTNPLLGPWASIQREIIQASEDEGWETGIPHFDRERLDAGIPLLHQCHLTVDSKRFIRLLRRLVDLAERFGAEGAAGPRRALNTRHY